MLIVSLRYLLKFSFSQKVRSFFGQQSFLHDCTLRTRDKKRELRARGRGGRRCEEADVYFRAALVMEDGPGLGRDPVAQSQRFGIVLGHSR